MRYTITVRTRTLLRLVVVTVAVCVAGTLALYQHFAAGAARPGAASMMPPASALVAGNALDGTAAPLFQLKDQRGRSIALARLRGHPVVLTFLDATCTTECPVTAQYLDWTAHYLGARAREVAWLALSVNPRNTRAQDVAFLTKHRVTVPLHILLGTRAQLAPLWRAYGIFVKPTRGDVEHTIVTYLIDGQGREREVLDQTYDPRLAAHDIRALLAA